MIYDVMISDGARPGAPTDRRVVTVTVTADLATAHAIAQDLTSRMLGQPSAVPEGGDERALSVFDLAQLAHDHRDTATVRAGHHLWRWDPGSQGWRCPEYTREALTHDRLIAIDGPLTEA